MKKTMLFVFVLLNQVNAFSQDQSDSTLLKKLESELQDTVTAPATIRRSTLSFNPDIGVIGDFRAAYISKGKRNIDAYLKETEISLQSVVDPYIRADFFISMSRDQSGTYGVDVEEGYLTTLTLPARLQLRAGKFKQAMGRINTVHSHALPFVDLPLAYVAFFGEEGLNDEGVSVSWLLPTRSVYQELVFETTAGLSESPLFRRSERNKLQYLAHLKNVFTINENSTLEAGITGIAGPNEFVSTTTVAAADLTYKWKPVRLNTYHSLTWQSEIFITNADDDSLTFKSTGFYSYLEYQLAKRFFLTGRYDYAENPFYQNINEQAFSLTGSFQASEFHRIQMEVIRRGENYSKGYIQGWLRWVFIIGAHGSHQY